MPQQRQLYKTGKASATGQTAVQDREGQFHSTDSCTRLGRPVPHAGPKVQGNLLTGKATTTVQITGTACAIVQVSAMVQGKDSETTGKTSATVQVKECHSTGKRQCHSTGEASSQYREASSMVKGKPVPQCREGQVLQFSVAPRGKLGLPGSDKYFRALTVACFAMLIIYCFVLLRSMRCLYVNGSGAGDVLFLQVLRKIKMCTFPMWQRAQLRNCSLLSSQPPIQFKCPEMEKTRGKFFHADEQYAQSDFL